MKFVCLYTLTTLFDARFCLPQEGSIPIRVANAFADKRTDMGSASVRTAEQNEE